MLTLEVLDALDGCRLFHEPTLNLDRVARLYCTLYQQNMELGENRALALDKGRHDIVEAIDLAMTRSSWVFNIRALTRRMVAAQPGGPVDSRVARDLLEPAADAVGCAEGREAIAKVLEQQLAVRSIIEELAKGDGTEAVSLPEAPSREYHAMIRGIRQLERAPLAGMICESTLDIRARGIAGELPAPIIRFDAVPEGQPHMDFFADW